MSQTRLGTATLVLLALAALPLGCSGQVVHPADRSTGGPHIYSVSTDGSNVRPLKVAGIGLSRGPDGRIAFLQRSRLAVMNDDGTGVRLLAQADRGSEDPVAPSWSPDGRRLAIGKGHGCDPFQECRSWSLSIVDVATGTRRGVIAFGKEPSWSQTEARLPMRAVQPTGIAIPRCRSEYLSPAQTGEVVGRSPVADSRLGRAAGI